MVSIEQNNLKHLTTRTVTTASMRNYPVCVSASIPAVDGFDWMRQKKGLP